MLERLRFKVDYLSFNLDDILSIREFSEIAAESILDPQTGEVIRASIDTGEYKIYPIGSKTFTVSVWRGGIESAIKIARAYELPITRVDIACDIFTDESETALALLDRLDNQASEFFKETGINPTRVEIKGQSNYVNGPKTVSYWSRSGQKQLRLYTKRMEGEPDFTRAEWQVRGDLAKRVWEGITQEKEIPVEALKDAFTGITSEYLYDGFFGFSSENPLDVTLEKSTPDASGYDQWLLETVASSVARKFLEDGVDRLSLFSQAVREKIMKTSTVAEVKVKMLREKKLLSAEYKRKAKADKALETLERRLKDGL